MKKFIAFTLAEVLASLTIVGVIAALTIPAVVTSAQSKMHTAGLKKAVTTLNQIIEMSVTDSRFQPVPKCFYWDKNPYGSATCVEWAKVDASGNPTGECRKYELPDGSGLPSNYNGEFSQCTNLFNYIRENLNVVKFCANNGVANGCMPEYEGIDTVAKASSPDKSDDDIVKETTGCGGWRKEAIQTKMALVTSDGMIFFPYTSNYASIIAVDVNGKTGPNKWGYDVFSLYSVGNNGIPPAYAYGGCTFIEKGGVSGTTRLMQD